MRPIFKLALAAIWTITSFSAYAVPIAIDLTRTFSEAQIQSVLMGSQILSHQFGVPDPLPEATGDATLTLSVRADLNSANEFIDVSVDGTPFGSWLNSNLGDDQIIGPTGDVGSQLLTILVGTLVIPLADLLVMLNDGVLELQLAFSNGVTPLGGEGASIRLQYNGDDGVVDVPEPSTLGLLAAGLLGLFMRRKRVA